MIKLFILRHGDATYDAPTDSQRQLSARGQADVQQTVSRLSGSLRQLHKMVVSPYVRAQQTADIALHEFKSGGVYVDGDIRENSALLTPEGSVEDCVNYLFDVIEKDLVKVESPNVLVVSHQPLVSSLLCHLCESVTSSNDVRAYSRYPMGTGNIAYLEMPVLAKGCAELLASYRPG